MHVYLKLISLQTRSSWAISDQSGVIKYGKTLEISQTELISQWNRVF